MTGPIRITLSHEAALERQAMYLSLRKSLGLAMGKAQRISWPAIAEVIGLKGGAGPQFEGSLVTVPDADLPSGLDGKALGAKLAAWRSGG